MRISRGCGCLLLALAGVNLIFLIGSFLGIFVGNVDPLWLGLLAVAVFAANLVSSLMVGLAGFRSQPLGSAGGADEEDSEVAAEEEGDSAIDE